MGWSLVHPVRLQAQHWEHSLQVLRALCCEAVFSVMGSEAGYTETVDGDYSDFELAYGVYRQ